MNGYDWDRTKDILKKTCTVNTGCPRRNVPNFGRVFLMLNYTDITQNTYIQSWTVTEIMAREKCGLPSGSTHCMWSADLVSGHVLSLSLHASVACSQPASVVSALVTGSSMEWQCLLCIPTWNIATCILCMDFVMVMEELLF